MWFDTEAVPLAFTEESPHHLAFEATIKATPERVFDIFATGEGQEGWFQDSSPAAGRAANRTTSARPARSSSRCSP